MDTARKAMQELTEGFSFLGMMQEADICSGKAARKT